MKTLDFITIFAHICIGDFEGRATFWPIDEFVNLSLIQA
jgi:hypothetical protein